MKIVFLGSGAFGLPALGALAASQHEILHVISQPDRPAGRGKQMTPTPVAAWAAAHDMPVMRTENANAPEVMAALRALRLECLVVIAFGQKLSNELLAVAPHGGINLHSSLLPKYRGAAPINWAVINNDATAGVSVIEVTAVMDAGDILAAAQTPIGPAETAGELHDRLAALGAPLLPAVLDQMAAGTLARSPQDAAAATRAPKLSREMAWVDFSQPAAAVSARLRGMSPWPAVQVEFAYPGRPAVTAAILKCQATASVHVHSPEHRGTILPDHTIACASGSIELLTIQPAGKKAMDARAFANGYGMLPGTVVRSVIAPPLHA